MGNYTSELQYERLDDTWLRTKEDFSFYFTLEEVYGEDHGELWRMAELTNLEIDERIYINIPCGFIFDGASFPKWLRPIFKASDGRYVKHAALHDMLYGVLHSHISEIEYPSHLWLLMEHGDRLFADLLFDMAMKVGGIKDWRRKLVILGVRIGGSSSYSPDCQEEIDYCKAMPRVKARPGVHYLPFTYREEVADAYFYHVRKNTITPDCSAFFYFANIKRPFLLHHNDPVKVKAN